MNRVRRIFRPQFVIPAVIVLLILGRLALHYGAELTVKGAFYDALGMGGAYATRWHTTVLLGTIGVGFALLLRCRCSSCAAGPNRSCSTPTPPRWAIPATRAATRSCTGSPASAGAPTPSPGIPPAGWCGGRSSARVARHVRHPDRGHRADPRLGARRVARLAQPHRLRRRRPGLRHRCRVLRLLRARIGRASPGSRRSGLPSRRSRSSWSALGCRLWSANASARSRGRGHEPHHDIRVRARRPVCSALAIQIWLSRYALTRAGDGDVLGGAGAAVRGVDIPTRTVGAGFVAAMALGLLRACHPGSARPRGRVPVAQAILGSPLVWAAVALALAIVATPWWLILLVPALAAVAWARNASSQRTRVARQPTPTVLLWPIVVARQVRSSSPLLGPVGAALNDAIVLRGSQLQVERENIEATLRRPAARPGLDKAKIVAGRLPQRRRDAAAIDSRRHPSRRCGSWTSRRPARPAHACRRSTSSTPVPDVDVDRYTIAGRKRTLFVIGREIDYPTVLDVGLPAPAFHLHARVRRDHGAGRRDRRRTPADPSSSSAESRRRSRATSSSRRSPNRDLLRCAAGTAVGDGQHRSAGVRQDDQREDQLDRHHRASRSARAGVVSRSPNSWAACRTSVVVAVSGTRPGPPCRARLIQRCSTATSAAGSRRSRRS